MDLSDRIESVAPSPTLSISAKAGELEAQGVDVVSFSAGEPDFDTPEHIVRAAERALAAGKTRYTASRGIAQLREAIAEDYDKRGRDVDPDQVVVTVGAKQALYNASQVLFQEGDAVAIPAPYWVSYPAQAHLAEAEVREVFCGLDQEFKLEPEQLDEVLSDDEVRGLVLCSPSNPTGAVYSEAELEALADVLVEHPDVAILFDAIYDRLYYGGEVAPDLVDVGPDQLGERTITFNGFSKAYAMTGWRLGYSIAPPEVADALAKLQSQSTSNATTFVQHAGLEALRAKHDNLAERREVFEGRRDLIVEGLNAIEGVSCPKPKGAFYAFPDFSDHVGDGGRFDDDLELVEHLLDEVHVAAVHGSAFGAPGHVRFSYATDEATIEEGLERIASALE